VQYQLLADGAPAAVRPWFLGSRITEAVRGLRPDVVHVDGLVFPMVVRHLRWKLPRKAAILVQDHGGFHQQSRSFRTWRGRAFYRFGLAAADGFLFTARQQAVPWMQAGIIANGGAVHEVVESSTDMASWPIQAPGVLPGRPALLWVGRLDANKDPITVLEGFERVADLLPEAALTMVYGEDDLLPEVELRIARSPSLRGRVHLRGRLARSALPAAYAGADIFVLGSHHEVACFSLMEALSFGVIPVVTDIPAFRAITGGGRVGALFAAGDPRAFAEAIVATVRGGAISRDEVRAYFARELSWSAVGRRALSIYRAAAASRTPSPTRARSA
jgi:glycosyltransferase involved in cell wall biosynthesis